MRNLVSMFLAMQCIVCICVDGSGQSLKSPSDFLGYPLGERFTYHHRVIDYFEYIESQSEKVLLYEYGKTYERRALKVAYLSSPENLKNIEEIRMNNLRRTGIIEGEPAESDVGIIWFSYNVHGNEANSTETSMKVLYDLVGGENNKYDKWLDKLVIVLDPCLNPDGRDRYANWYNQVANTTPNPNIESREHNENWPQGRFNHYMFDLNRDWVWQTQIESKQRLKLYNDWMPHVHVDFHEQYYNSQYYFAPAAAPYHEVITDWQKEFQEIVGNSNAKYFDEKGWLYFTRETFDLLYPGYGDTYPTFNGAIGMTYEMPGHSTAGLAIKTNKGDTLTLTKRIDMHYTTSMATLETCFNNRVKLITEFDDYFNDTKEKNEVYILKSTNQDRIELLADLLDKNRIVYKSSTYAKPIKAYSYNKNETVSIQINSKDLIIPQNQPKSSLVNVLFERNTKLLDSLTYDITAWSLPFVYGLDAYQASINLELSEYNSHLKRIEKTDKIPYAYLLNWNSIKDAQFISEILDQGYRVNYSTKTFTYNGSKFNAGTLIINRIDNSNVNFGDELINIANSLNRNLIPIYSGAAISSIDLGSHKINYLKKPNIVLLSGDGIDPLKFGELWHYFEQEIKYPVNVIEKEFIKKINLDNYDILILASGRYDNLQNEDGFNKIDAWVKQGGKLILIEDAISGFVGENKFLLKEHKVEEKEVEELEPVLYPFENNERENLKKYIQGGIIKMEIDNTHPLAFGYEKYYYTLKSSNKAFKFLKDGWNVGYISTSDEVVAGYIGPESQQKLNKNLVFGVEQRGKGKVVYLVDDPIFRGFWQNGKLILANALFFDN